MTTHILYHANCADGFASACIAHLALKDSPTPIVFHAISYDDKCQMPEGLLCYGGEGVYYLDYTPPASTIAALMGTGPEQKEVLIPQVANLTIIDHHSGCAEAIHAGLKWTEDTPVRSIFDRTQCGADLTWNHFFPRQTRPIALQLLSFYDLGGPWQNPKDPKSQAALNLQAGLMRATPRTFAEWMPLLLASHKDEALQTCISLGEKLRQADQEVIAAACRRPLWLDFEGHLIPAITGVSPELTNDACHFLLGMYPSAPFVANFFVDAPSGRIRYRLRSRKDGFNVCDLAKRLDPPTEGHPGGGGHPCAAGFSTLAPLPRVTA